MVHSTVFIQSVVFVDLVSQQLSVTLSCVYTWPLLHTHSHILLGAKTIRKNIHLVLITYNLLVGVKFTFYYVKSKFNNL